MSLTSYRAAPPRDKPLRACLEKTSGETGLVNAATAPILSVPKGFLRRQPGGHMAGGCGRYVPTQARFGKGAAGGFFDFVTGKWGRNGLKPSRRSSLLPKVRSRTNLST